MNLFIFTLCILALVMLTQTVDAKGLKKKKLLNGRTEKKVRNMLKGIFNSMGKKRGKSKHKRQFQSSSEPNSELNDLLLRQVFQIPHLFAVEHNDMPQTYKNKLNKVELYQPKLLQNEGIDLEQYIHLPKLQLTDNGANYFNLPPLQNVYLPAKESVEPDYQVSKQLNIINLLKLIGIPPSTNIPAKESNEPDYQVSKQLNIINLLKLIGIPPSTNIKQIPIKMHDTSHQKESHQEIINNSNLHNHVEKEISYVINLIKKTQLDDPSYEKQVPRNLQEKVAENDSPVIDSSNLNLKNSPSNEENVSSNREFSEKISKINKEINASEKHLKSAIDVHSLFTEENICSNKEYSERLTKINKELDHSGKHLKSAVDILSSLIKRLM